MRGLQCLIGTTPDGGCTGIVRILRTSHMFSFFSKKTPAPAEAAPEAARQSWLGKLRTGLRKTGSSIATVFTGTQIDDALYEHLEEALLMADAGVAATQFLLDDLKRRVKDSKTTEPAAVK